MTGGEARKGRARKNVLLEEHVAGVHSVKASIGRSTHHSGINGFAITQGGCSFRGENRPTKGFATPFREFFVSIFRAPAFGRLCGGETQRVTLNFRTG